MRYYSSTAVVMALTGSVNELVTTIVVDTVLGLPAQTPFTLVVDVGLSTEEIVTVTDVSGTNLTVTRGEDGSAAVAHTAGAIVRHMMTARDLREPAVHVAATTYVHGIGATASVVGTDTAQTLTNKTVNFADNTAIGVPQASVTGLVDDIAALVLADVGLVADMVDAVNPIGTVLMWAGGTTAPGGYLLADGSAKNRTTYSALFAVIGTTYGAGDGFTTFALPALSGRVIVGFDATQAEFDAMGEAGGAKTHILSAAEMPVHTHVQDAHNHTQAAHTHGILTFTNGTSATGDRVSSSDTAIGTVLPGGSVTATSTATNNASTATNQNAGSGGAHNNLQPYIVLRYIIKT